eukprot:jgi/Chlat1/3223/Chrsp22S03421
MIASSGEAVGELKVQQVVPGPPAAYAASSSSKLEGGGGQAPGHAAAASDWLHGLAGCDWLAYASPAGSAVVLAVPPAPVSSQASAAGVGTGRTPFYQQVLPVSTESSPSSPPSSLAWCPDQSGHLAAAAGSCVCIYSARNTAGASGTSLPLVWEEEATINVSFAVRALSWSGDSRSLLVCGSSVAVYARTEAGGWHALWISEGGAESFEQDHTLVAAGTTLNSPAASACQTNETKGGCAALIWVKQDERTSTATTAAAARTAVVLQHPAALTALQWRPEPALTPALLTNSADGIVRLWMGVPFSSHGQTKRSSSTSSSSKLPVYRIFAVIQPPVACFPVGWPKIEQLDGPSVPLDEPMTKCDWLAGVGRDGSLFLWAIHELDDSVLLKAPRVVLWVRAPDLLLHGDVGSMKLSSPRSPTKQTAVLQRAALHVVVYTSRGGGGTPPAKLELHELLPNNTLRSNLVRLPPPSSISATEATHGALGVSGVGRGGKLHLKQYFSLDLAGHAAKVVSIQPNVHTPFVATLDENGTSVLWSLNDQAPSGLIAQLTPDHALGSPSLHYITTLSCKATTIAWLPINTTITLLCATRSAIEVYSSSSDVSHKNGEEADDAKDAVMHKSGELSMPAGWEAASGRVVHMSTFSRPSAQVLLSAISEDRTTCLLWLVQQKGSALTVIRSTACKLEGVSLHSLSQPSLGTSPCCVGFATSVGQGHAQLWVVESTNGLHLQRGAEFQLSCDDKALVKATADGGRVFIAEAHSSTARVCEAYSAGGSFCQEAVLDLQSPALEAAWLQTASGVQLLAVSTIESVSIFCPSRSNWRCLSKVHCQQPVHTLAWSRSATLLAASGSKLLVYNDFVHSAASQQQLAQVAASISGPLPEYHPRVLLHHLSRDDKPRARAALRLLAGRLNSQSGNSRFLPLADLVVPKLQRFVLDLKAAESAASSDELSSGMLSAGNVQNAGSTTEPPTETINRVKLFSTLGGVGGATGLFSARSGGTEGGNNTGNDHVGSKPMSQQEAESLAELVAGKPDLPGVLATERVELLALIDNLAELDAGRDANLSFDTGALHLRTALRMSAAIHRRDGHAMLTSREFAWALHSETQESLLNTIMPEQLTWPAVRALGVPFWVSNLGTLRSWAEKLARAQFVKSKDPHDCALLYLALDRRPVLIGLFKTSRNEKDKRMFEFLARDFTDPRHQTAALKNAYVLLGQHRHELAAAFFLIGGSLEDAANVLAKGLPDPALALLVCRLREGDGGHVYMQLVRDHIMPLAIEQNDMWMKSVAMWLLGNHIEALQAVVPEENNHNPSVMDPSVGEYCSMLAARRSVLAIPASALRAAGLVATAASRSAFAYEACGMHLQALSALSTITDGANGSELLAASVQSGMRHRVAQACVTRALFAGIDQDVVQAVRKDIEYACEKFACDQATLLEVAVQAARQLRMPYTADCLAFGYDDVAASLHTALNVAETEVNNECKDTRRRCRPGALAEGVISTVVPLLWANGGAPMTRINDAGGMPLESLQALERFADEQEHARADRGAGKQEFAAFATRVLAAWLAGNTSRLLDALTTLRKLFGIISWQSIITSNAASAGETDLNEADTWLLLGTAVAHFMHEAGVELLKRSAFDDGEDKEREDLIMVVVEGMFKLKTGLARQLRSRILQAAAACMGYDGPTDAPKSQVHASLPLALFIITAAENISPAPSPNPAASSSAAPMHEPTSGDSKTALRYVRVPARFQPLWQQFVRADRLRALVGIDVSVLHAPSHGHMHSPARSIHNIHEREDAQSPRSWSHENTTHVLNEPVLAHSLSKDLLEGVCAHPCDPYRLAIATNRRGILEFDLRKGGHVHISGQAVNAIVEQAAAATLWSQVQWPPDPWSERAALAGSPAWVVLNERHGDVTCKACSVLASHPVRPLYLSGSVEGDVHLWQFGQHSAVALYSPAGTSLSPPAAVCGLDFSASGHRFALVRGDGAIALWRLEHGRIADTRHCFQQQGNAVSMLGSSESVLVAAGLSANDENLCVWDTMMPPRSAIVASFKCHAGGARAVTCIGDTAQMLASGGRSGHLAVHDLRKGGRSESVWENREAHSDSVTSIVALPASMTSQASLKHSKAFVSSCRDGDVNVWDASTCELRQSFHGVHRKRAFLNARGSNSVMQSAVTQLLPTSLGLLSCGGDGNINLFTYCESDERHRSRQPALAALLNFC